MQSIGDNFLVSRRHHVGRDRDACLARSALPSPPKTTTESDTRLCREKYPSHIGPSHTESIGIPPDTQTRSSIRQTFRFPHFSFYSVERRETLGNMFHGRH